MSDLSTQPAFPRPASQLVGWDDGEEYRQTIDEEPGMTLRQYYAGLALPAAMRGLNFDEGHAALAARIAVRCADALLHELEASTSEGDE